jgi:hypothetical protein
MSLPLLLACGYFYLMLISERGAVSSIYDASLVSRAMENRRVWPFLWAHAPPTPFSHPPVQSFDPCIWLAVCGLHGLMIGSAKWV